MKKTYISPAARMVDLCGEESLMVLALSDTKAAGNEALSNKKEFGAWNSENWSGDVAGDTED